MASLNTMAKRCFGLLGTHDITPWEQGFLERIAEQTKNGDDTSSLSERQVVSLENIHDKHFEG